MKIEKIAILKDKFSDIKRQFDNFGYYMGQ